MELKPNFWIRSPINWLSTYLHIKIFFRSFCQITNLLWRKLGELTDLEKVDLKCFILRHRKWSESDFSNDWVDKSINCYCKSPKSTRTWSSVSCKIYQIVVTLVKSVTKNNAITLLKTPMNPKLSLWHELIRF